MKIGIDISPVLYGTGVSVYTKNLVKHLLALDGEDHYVLFGGSLRRKKELHSFINSLEGNYTSKLTNIPPTLMDLIWNRLHVGKIERFTGSLDVFHSSDWSQPPADCFKVTTIHDLSVIRFAKLMHPRIVSTHKARLRRIQREIDRVIVPSLATKEELALFNIDPEKIFVIPEAVEEGFKPATISEVASLKRKLHLKSKFLLAVGVGPRKNTDNIIKAFELVRGGMNMKLLIVGHDHYGYGQNRGVRFLGHITNDELRSLYSGAQALVYPSVYEGFGLPILEAFACHAPVVTSNTSSMPEVAGEAAVLVDPFDVYSIAEGIKEAIQEKKSLVSKGKKQLKNFSWDKTAKMTLEVYREAKS